jgi:hypothetical protein
MLDSKEVPKTPAPRRYGPYAKQPSAMTVRQRKVGRIVRRMRIAMPWLGPSDIPAVRAWAEADVIGAALFASIQKAGAVREIEGDVIARRVVNDWRQIKLLQLAYEKELGMTPVARAQLTTSKQPDFDLVAAMAQRIDEAEPVEPQPPQGVGPEPESVTEKS